LTHSKTLKRAFLPFFFPYSNLNDLRLFPRMQFVHGPIARYSDTHLWKIVRTRKKSFQKCRFSLMVPGIGTEYQKCMKWSKHRAHFSARQLTSATNSPLPKTCAEWPTADVKALGHPSALKGKQEIRKRDTWWAKCTFNGTHTPYGEIPASQLGIRPSKTHLKMTSETLARAL
jgi:hypothetical protein